MRFGSVCSGIEAASVAWKPLGWAAAWFSEIEPFPCAVLKHHYPDVHNHGDMTTLPERILSGEVEAPDLFCGGTPCQAFSVAGLRNSLDDSRGNLSLTFVGIANAIDHVRSVRRDSPAIIFWENVPGVLSTKDNAFGCFLAGLAGEDNPLEPPRGKWTNSGYVLGPKRAVAWRLLDAQYFGLAQRRKRVFVVASARDDFDPAAVLFEFDGVRRDTAPSRQAREGVAGGIEIGPGGGRLTDLNPTLDTRAKDGPIRNQLAGAVLQKQWPAELASTLDTTFGTKQGLEDWHVSAGCPLFVPAYAIQGSMINRNDKAGPQGDGINKEVCFTQNTIDRHAVAQPIAFAQNQRDEVRIMQVAGALAAAPGMKQQTYLAQPIPIDMRNAGRDPEKHDEINRQGVGVGEPGDPAHTVTSAFVHGVANGMAVRRLTPVECERLQGFPDGYTNIPWRKKPESPDGPRYKALGNSWAVPVVRWIGKRIQEAV